MTRYITEYLKNKAINSSFKTKILKKIKKCIKTWAVWFLYIFYILAKGK